ncbi:hypothetical protein SynWH8103_00487 [Synechococcus sp. WH 8103]|nr:hypothetical protein SynWH8103_00487 [Synechococcus sp. WH 8103]
MPIHYTGHLHDDLSLRLIDLGLLRPLGQIRRGNPAAVCC